LVSGGSTLRYSLNLFFVLMLLRPNKSPLWEGYPTAVGLGAMTHLVASCWEGAMQGEGSKGVCLISGLHQAMVETNKFLVLEQGNIPRQGSGTWSCSPGCKMTRRWSQTLSSFGLFLLE
jgi:hypothetical protein